MRPPFVSARPFLPCELRAPSMSCGPNLARGPQSSSRDLTSLETIRISWVRAHLSRWGWRWIRAWGGTLVSSPFWVAVSFVCRRVSKTWRARRRLLWPHHTLLLHPARLASFPSSSSSSSSSSYFSSSSFSFSSYFYSLFSFSAPNVLSIFSSTYAQSESEYQPLSRFWQHPELSFIGWIFSSSQGKSGQTSWSAI